MRLYEARIELKSPAILTTRRTDRGYVKPSTFIPGSTLRGALLTALFREKILTQSDLKKEASEPSILTSAAFPVVRGKRTLPATPFMATCKVCGATIDLTREAARALEQGEQPRFPDVCPRCREAVPLENLHGSPVYLDGGTLRRASLRSFRATSVGISKRRGAAAKGLLFDYEAIAEGSELWALVSATENLQLPGELEVTLGRGGSRGFGWALLRLTNIALRQVPTRGIFIALSPLTPLPSINWGATSVQLKAVVGRTMQIHLGWDLLRGESRPFCTVARTGSLALVEWSGETAQLLTGLPVTIEGHVAVGLNALLDLETYYKLLEGGSS
ncbi:MAG: RAMP superfamily CRISPR-associated protein [Infirmifilum sp.]